MTKPNPIQDLMDAEKLSVTDIERKTGVHRKTINRARHEGVVPTGEPMEKICKGLNYKIQPNDFFDIPKSALVRRAHDLIHRGGQS